MNLVTEWRRQRDFWQRRNERITHNQQTGKRAALFDVATQVSVPALPLT